MLVTNPPIEVPVRPPYLLCPTLQKIIPSIPRARLIIPIHHTPVHANIEKKYL